MKERKKTLEIMEQWKYKLEYKTVPRGGVSRMSYPRGAQWVSIFGALEQIQECRPPPSPDTRRVKTLFWVGGMKNFPTLFWATFGAQILNIS